MISPPVSILITLYNREKYIEQAIESVINQSYQNWELLILDDRSTDDSYQKAKNFESKDDRIKVLRNGKNLGQFKNRNAIASLAKGKYLKYLDSDDMLYKYSLNIMVEAMEQYPQAAFAFQHQLKEDNTPYPIFLSSKEAYFEHFLSKSGLFNCGPSGVIFRHEIFRKEKGFKTSDNYVGNDTELLIRLGLKYPSIKLQPALVWWRQHESQAINSGRTSGEYLLNEFHMQYSFLADRISTIPSESNNEAIDFLKWKNGRKILIEFRRGNFQLAIKMFRNLPLSMIDLFKALFDPEIIKVKS